MTEGDRTPDHLVARGRIREDGAARRMASELEGPWAWLSIDGRDNDPAHLWAYLIAAMQRLAGPVGDQALAEPRRRGGAGQLGVPPNTLKSSCRTRERRVG